MRESIIGNGCKGVALHTGLGLEPKFLVPVRSLECAHDFARGIQMENSKCYAKMSPLGTLNIARVTQASVQSAVMCQPGASFSPLV